MANLFVRTYTFVDGTVAYGSQVEAEIGNIVTVLNSLNAGTTTWGIVSTAHATSVPLIADCSSGSQHIADFKNNSVIKASVSSAGLITCVGAAVGSQKITGLANGTAATDAMAFGQSHYTATPVMGTSTTSFTTSSNTFQASNLTASITPTTSSSKIKITASFTGYLANAATEAANFTLYRNTTNLGPAVGMATLEVGTAATAQNTPVTLIYIDSPATTSATSYTVRVRSVNGAANSGVGSSFLADQQTIILEEII